MIPEPEIIRKSYTGSNKLKGKTALITGGDSGIGRSIAVHFAREGANIAIAYYTETKDAEETKKMVIAEGQDCIVMKGDIKKESFCKSIIEKTVKKFGSLNILVNNAAMNPIAESQNSSLQFSPYERYPIELWRHEFEVGLTGEMAQNAIVSNIGLEATAAATAA